MIKKAEQLLAGCETVSLASVTQEEYPRICILSKIKADGIKSIWFATGTESKKTVQFQQNPKASVCYGQGGDSVTLLGDVTVITDAALKQELWQDWFIDHFPGGATDPTYCILRFDAAEATIWIDGVFETHSVK